MASSSRRGKAKPTKVVCKCPEPRPRRADGMSIGYFMAALVLTITGGVVTGLIINKMTNSAPLAMRAKGSLPP